MKDTYFFERIVRLMHGEIRRYDKEGMIVARYAGSEPSSDPFCTDEAFLKEVMSRPGMSKPDLFVENSCIYYCRIDFAEGCLLIGPIRVEPREGNLKIWMMEHHNIPMSRCRVPYCEWDIYLNCILLLHHHLNGQEISADELGEIRTAQEITEIRHLDQVLFQRRETNIPHNPYSHEVRKLDSIAAGDVETLKQCQNEVWDGEMGRVGATPVRQEKNMAIVVIALACRAAIRGGLSPELAYSMSDMQIMNIDKMTDLLQIKKALYAYEVEYAQCVHQLQKPLDRNQYAEKAKGYIFMHLHDQLRVCDIAEYLGVNKDYLSALFHKTEGITLQDYITREKMRLAEHMLRYSDQRVSEIANILSYSSQSHFCYCFRKQYGMTPLEYRNQYRTI